MNCANHPEVSAVAFCRRCGKPMCQECERPALGSIYCAEHLPPGVTQPPVAHSPYAAPPPPVASPVYDTGAHPVLALILGFIPGVGAICNGQCAKGLIHAVVFGLLVSVESSVRDPLFAPLGAILIGAWVFYMAFEAYHTARKRRFGFAVEEFSSLLDVRPVQGRVPAGAVLLITLGFVLLLVTTDILSMDQLMRYWPAGLIILGLYMLYSRVSHSAIGHLPVEKDNPGAGQ